MTLACSMRTTTASLDMDTSGGPQQHLWWPVSICKNERGEWVLRVAYTAEEARKKKVRQEIRDLLAS